MIMSSKKQMYETSFLPIRSHFLIELYKCPLEIIRPSSSQKLIGNIADFCLPGLYYEARSYALHEEQLHDLVIAKLENIKGVDNVTELSWVYWQGHRYCLSIESGILPHSEHYKILEEIRKIPGIEHVAPLIPAIDDEDTN